MTIPAVTAPFLGAALILSGAGMAKLWQPADTARALRAAGLPATRQMVRAGATVEVGVGVSAFVYPGAATGALVAAAYLAFAAFVVAARVKGWPLSSCGCFGRADSRPTYLHAALNALAASASIWWCASRPPPLASVFGHQPWSGVPLAGLIVVIAGLAYAIWTNPVGRVAR